MSEAPRSAKIPAADSVSPEMLPDEPLEIVFADELSLEGGANPGPAAEPVPPLMLPDKPKAAMKPPESASAQSSTQKPGAPEIA